MKPTRNQVFCLGCSRSKMLFETESKANNFINFNKEEIQLQSGFSPERSYYCSFCDGWHTTSIKNIGNKSQKERMLDEHIENKGISIIKPKKQQIDIRNYWERIIENIPDNEKEVFLNENISLLKAEIKPLVGYKNDLEKDKLKDLRKSEQYLFILRKHFGFHNSKSFVISDEKIHEKRLEEMDSYKEWASKIYK